MSDPTRAVADMLTYDPEEPVKFFVLDREDGSQLVHGKRLQISNSDSN